jgi:hypothetical protein
MMLKKSLFSVFSGMLLFAGCRTESQKQSITPPHLKMMLPEVIYAAPGIESNIYFDYIIDSATPRAYAFEVKCERGTHGTKRWFWTPDKTDSGKSFDCKKYKVENYSDNRTKRSVCKSYVRVVGFIAVFYKNTGKKLYHFFLPFHMLSIDILARILFCVNLKCEKAAMFTGSSPIIRRFNI